MKILVFFIGIFTVVNTSPYKLRSYIPLKFKTSFHENTENPNNENSFSDVIPPLEYFSDENVFVESEQEKENPEKILDDSKEYNEESISYVELFPPVPQHPQRNFPYFAKRKNMDWLQQNYFSRRRSYPEAETNIKNSIIGYFAEGKSQEVNLEFGEIVPILIISGLEGDGKYTEPIESSFEEYQGGEDLYAVVDFSQPSKSKRIRANPSNNLAHQHIHYPSFPKVDDYTPGISSLMEVPHYQYSHHFDYPPKYFPYQTIHNQSPPPRFPLESYYNYHYPETDRTFVVESQGPLVVLRLPLLEALQGGSTRGMRLSKKRQNAKFWSKIRALIQV